MSVEENKAIVRQWVTAAWNGGDFSSAESLYPPEYVLHFGGQDMQGAGGLTDFIRMYRRAMPDIHMSIEDLVGEDDLVAWRITTRGTQTNELMGIAPSGKAVSVGAIVVSRFAGGQWVEDWVNNDDLGLLQQIGAIPAPGH